MLVGCAFPHKVTSRPHDVQDKSDIQSPIKMKLMYKLVQKEPRYPVEGAGLPDIDRLPILNQKEASKVFEVGL